MELNTEMNTKNTTLIGYIFGKAEEATLSQQEIIVPKIFAMMGLVMTSLACSSVPYILATLCSRWDLQLMDSKLMSFLNCISAGFYLGLTFLYFLVNARKYFTIYITKVNVNIQYPILEGMVCAGFIMVSVIESAVHLGASISTVVVGSASSSIASGASLQERAQRQHVRVVSPTLQKIVVILSLSFQTFFAGAAIGLQHQVSEVFQLMIAIMVYVSVVSFDLGQKLFAVYHRRPLKAFYIGLLFAIVGPVGISVGIAVSELELRKDLDPLTLLSGLFLSFSSGIFLHVTFMNHMHVKIPSRTYYNGFLRLLFMIIGLVLVSILKILHTDAIEDFLYFAKQ